jgi:protein-S-isoprenylcysteine O-methyltransferase Ste14
VTLLRNLIATLLGPLALTVGIPFLIMRSGLAAIPAAWGFWQLAGLLVLVTGLIVACWCMWAFIFIGRGMPASVDPPKRLVASGLYRFTRNPMYGGVLLILLGEALCLASIPLALYTALAWLALHGFVVIYEEPAMRRRFGDSYVAYCQSTPRWLPIPAKLA